MIFQFGTSRFLQAHVALFAHQAREAGQDVAPIVVIKTTPGGTSAARDARLAGFADRNGYRVIVRGLHDGAVIDETIRVTSVIDGMSAQRDWAALVALACGPLRHVVSNAGDTGYDVAADEPLTLPAKNAPHSFPAMLLALLYERWSAGGSGVTVLPCELVRHNGATLHAIVGELARGSGAPPAFIAWLDMQCIWVNTLVDRIVSTALEPVGAITEPYALWAIEEQPGLVLPFSHPAITVTADLDRFERLKLHILNLGHTWLAERWSRHGAPADLTVRESLADPATRAAFDALFADEVIPGFARHDLETVARAYLATTIERFANPFLDHRIADIHSGHVQKIAKRVATFITWVDSATSPLPPLALTQLRALAQRHPG